MLQAKQISSHVANFKKNQHVFHSIQLKKVNQSKFNNGTLLHILQNTVTDEERITSAAKLI